MDSTLSWVLACVFVAGCGSSAPPPDAPGDNAVPPPRTSASPLAEDPGDPSARPEAEVRRDQLVDHCFWGISALRIARDAYLAKLTPAEPGAGTTPVLLRGNNRPFSFQRAAGYCAAAVEATKATPSPALDALVALQPRTGPAADTLVQLFACLDAACGKADGFARARALTEALRSGRKELDDLHDRLGAAVAARAAARSPRAAGMLGEAELAALIERARPLVAEIVASPAPAERGPRVEALAADQAAFTATASRGRTSFVRVAGAAAKKLVEVLKKHQATASLDEVAKLEVVDAFDSLIESSFLAVNAAIQQGGARVSRGGPRAAGALGPSKT